MADPSAGCGVIVNYSTQSVNPLGPEFRSPPRRIVHYTVAPPAGGIRAGRKTAAPGHAIIGAIRQNSRAGRMVGRRGAHAPVPDGRHRDRRRHRGHSGCLGGAGAGPAGADPGPGRRGELRRTREGELRRHLVRRLAPAEKAPHPRQSGPRPRRLAGLRRTGARRPLAPGLGRGLRGTLGAGRLRVADRPGRGLHAHAAVGGAGPVRAGQLGAPLAHRLGHGLRAGRGADPAAARAPARGAARVPFRSAGGGTDDGAGPRHRLPRPRGRRRRGIRGHGRVGGHRGRRHQRQPGTGAAELARGLERAAGSHPERLPQVCRRHAARRSRHPRRGHHSPGLAVELRRRHPPLEGPQASPRPVAGAAQVRPVAELAGRAHRPAAAGDRLRHPRPGRADLPPGARLLLAASEPEDRAEGARHLRRRVQSGLPGQEAPRRGAGPRARQSLAVRRTRGQFAGLPGGRHPAGAGGADERAGRRRLGGTGRGQRGRHALRPPDRPGPALPQRRPAAPHRLRPALDR